MNEPRTFGPYLLLRRLAVGGMAEIYVASTRGLGGFEKLAALKLVHPHLAADPHFVRMLIEEAKISVLLTHANIAQVFDLGCIDGTYYIAMEFVDGMDIHGMQTTAQQLAQPLPIAVCAYAVAEMLNGLDYAHRKRDASGRPLNIVHRDISPQNVVVSQAGEVKLVDFGIAKSSQTEGTEAGIIKGKYFYMSPEQAWGDATDRRSDVFSTGILLHEMLTGHMLYSGKSVPELIAKVRQADIVPPTALRRDLPQQLSDIVMRALEREPGARFQSAIDMGEALRDFLYEAYPAFNASKLGEFVVKMVEAQRERQAHRPSNPDDSRKLRALTREEFVHRENSVLFNLRDGGMLATRQEAPVKAKRTVPPPPPPAAMRRSIPPPPKPSLPPPPPQLAAGLVPGSGGRNSEIPRGRISTWPLEDHSQEDATGPTGLWNQSKLNGASNRAAHAAGAGLSEVHTGEHPPLEDMEPTGRYVPAQMAGLRAVRPNTPSILPSLEPPPPNTFDNAPVTGVNKPALMPPPSEADELPTPIPGTPPLPDFEERRGRVPWLAISIGIAAAVLGVVGFQAWPREAPPPHLEIDSDPSGAAVLVDGRAQPGSTPLRLVGLEAGRRYTLQVELPGYHTWSSSYLASGHATKQIAVLRAIRRTLQVVSTPTGASVYLGDTLVGRTPLALSDMAVGHPLRIRLELPGYAVERRTVTLSEDEVEPRLQVTLSPRR